MYIFSLFPVKSYMDILVGNLVLVLCGSDGRENSDHNRFIKLRGSSTTKQQRYVQLFSVHYSEVYLTIDTWQLCSKAHRSTKNCGLFSLMWSLEISIITLFAFLNYISSRESVTVPSHHKKHPFWISILLIMRTS